MVRLVINSTAGSLLIGELPIGSRGFADEFITRRAWTFAYSPPVRLDQDSSNPAADAAMDRYADGDSTAFVVLYDALVPRLYPSLLRRVRDQARAEDLVQQTMLQVHTARSRFVRGSRVTPWVFAIATRLFLDLARRKKLEILSDDGELVREPESDFPGPDVSVEREQLGALIRAGVEHLSAPQREAFELVYFGQMSHSEAAEALGVTVASIKLRLQRATRVVRDSLTDESPQGAGS
jgi:RNA polymerase sigma-70 factor (ECF subfamily)